MAMPSTDADELAKCSWRTATYWSSGWSATLAKRL
jgi:hypothetical protein